jgi:putative transposase
VSGLAQRAIVIICETKCCLNILSEGKRLLTAVGTPEVIKNACGELVRPGVIQAEIVEAGITPLLVV